MVYSFKGYLRNDGSAGIRNHIGIVSSVICSSVVTKEIAEQVPCAIPIVHTNGCAQIGDDFKVTKNMLVGIASNPNLYSTLYVGLGCETNQIAGLLESTPEEKRVKGIGIQQLAGGGNTKKKGIEIGMEWDQEINKMERQDFPLSSLTIGILSVDLDEDSVKQMTPVIGSMLDQLVESEVKVLYGLSQSLEPAGDLLAERATSEELKMKIRKAGEGLQRRRWKEAGNKSADIQGFTEKEIAQGHLEVKLTGTKPIKSVLLYGEEAKESGLHLISVPNNTVEALSSMASSGCHLVIIISSRGILTGSIVIPSITVAPEDPNGIFNELIDYEVIQGTSSIQKENLIKDLIEVCSGKQSILEKLEIGEFSIPHIGTTF